MRCDDSFRARSLVDPSCTAGDDCEYEYHRDENGEFIDPECAPEDEIDKWIYDKTIGSRVLNQMIDFEIERDPIRESEVWLPFMNLKNGYFHDQGFRYRLNHFDMRD